MNARLTPRNGAGRPRRKPHPLLFLAGSSVFVALILVLRLVAPVGGVSGQTVLAIGAVAAALLLGAGIPGPLRPRRVRAWSPATRSRVWTTAFVIGLASVFLRFSDRLRRGGFAASGFWEARNGLAGSETSPIGAIAAPLIGFSYIPLLWHLATGSRNRLQRLLSWLLFIYLPVESLFVGSRFQILISGSYIMILAAKGRRWRVGRLLALILGGSILLVGFSVVFHVRLGDFSEEPELAIYESGFAEHVRPSVSRQDFDSLPSFGQNIVFAVTWPLQYATHGIYELDAWISNPNAFRTPAWGRASAEPLVRVAEAAGLDWPGVLPSETGARPGVFATIAGPGFFDAGWAAIALFMFIGIAMTFSVRLVRAGRHEWVPLWLHLCVVAFMAPAVNMLASGFGSLLVPGYAAFGVAVTMARAKPGPRRHGRKSI